MKLKLLLILLSSIFLISTVFSKGEPLQYDGEGRGPGFENAQDMNTGFQNSNNQMQGKRNHRRRFSEIKKLKKEFPELAAKIKELKKDHPSVIKEFTRQLRNKNYRRIIFGLKSKDKETKELTKKYLNNELDSLLLSAKYRETKEEALKQELMQILNKSFEIKTELQHKFVGQMETRISKVKEMLEKRIEQKDKIIEQRINVLTEGKDVINW